MTNLFCCKNNCITLSVILSVIIGVVTTILTITAVLSLPSSFIVALLIIATAFLAITLIISPAMASTASGSCRCLNINSLLSGIYGTIVSGLVILSADFTATSTAGAVFSGIIMLFITLTLTSVFCLIKQLSCNN